MCEIVKGKRAGGSRFLDEPTEEMEGEDITAEDGKAVTFAPETMEPDMA